MNLKRPRDYRLLNQFSKLAAMVGQADAIILVDCLWTQLGYQLEQHGSSGFFQASEVEPFAASLPFNVVGGVMGKLVDSGWLIQRGENYECPLFFYYNSELDRNYIPNGSSGRYHKFAMGLKAIQRAAPVTVAELPDQLWQLANEVRILPAMMNEVILLIKTLDSLLGLGKRELKEYTLPLIHCAHSVTSTYSGDKLKVILRRLYFKKSIQGIPRNTLQCLQKFNDIVIMIMPDEGYAQWIKREGIKDDNSV